MTIATDPLSSHAYPQLADALRSQIDGIANTWEHEVRRILPSADKLTFDQVRDDLPKVLDSIARALESGEARETGDLFAATLAHGRTRFDQEFDLRELLMEYRILRPIVIDQVAGALGRPLEPGESAAMHVGIDIMVEQATMAFANFQQAQIRHAAEVERRFLSYMSHDMRNNLNSLVLTLELLKKRL